MMLHRAVFIILLCFIYLSGCYEASSLQTKSQTENDPKINETLGNDRIQKFMSNIAKLNKKLDKLKNSKQAAFNLEREISLEIEDIKDKEYKYSKELVVVERSVTLKNGEATEASGNRNTKEQEYKSAKELEATSQSTFTTRKNVDVSVLKSSEITRNMMEIALAPITTEKTKLVDSNLAISNLMTERNVLEKVTAATFNGLTANKNTFSTHKTAISGADRTIQNTKSNSINSVVSGLAAKITQVTSYQATLNAAKTQRELKETDTVNPIIDRKNYHRSYRIALEYEATLVGTPDATTAFSDHVKPLMVSKINEEIAALEQYSAKIELEETNLGTMHSRVTPVTSDMELLPTHYTTINTQLGIKKSKLADLEAAQNTFSVGLNGIYPKIEAIYNKEALITSSIKTSVGSLEKLYNSLRDLKTVDDKVSQINTNYENAKTELLNIFNSYVEASTSRGTKKTALETSVVAETRQKRIAEQEKTKKSKIEEIIKKLGEQRKNLEVEDYLQIDKYNKLIQSTLAEEENKRKFEELLAQYRKQT